MIKIKKTNKCDTRNMRDNELTEEDVKQDTLKHIFAVKDCGDFIRDKIETQFAHHDFTKLRYLDLFTKALKSGLRDSEFKKDEWWKIHESQERHHLNDRVPEDVNLIDVLEMICDCVSAGLARSGKVYDVRIDSTVLQDAVKNTFKLLIDNIEVEE